MKLYISYYGNYVSIVEGKYNKKKDKYIISNCIFLSEKDRDIDYNDKYSLLKKALGVIKWNAKDAVLCLNTRDVIIKNNSIQKAKPKDLDGIMANEMDEMMSLDLEENTFSYEVTKERKENDCEVLDLIIGAIRNEELDVIMGIFKDFKMNLERIDTISTAYGRLLKKIEYSNIMMINVGSYGSSVDIFKEDTLFIHDNIPTKIDERVNEFVINELVEEIKGLRNYYSSRNYGNAVETMVLVGECNDNEQLKQSFQENISENLVIGLENLFDIEDDIIGELEREEISKVSEILGLMCLDESRKSYSSMNLLPYKYKNKQSKKNSVKQYIKAAPIGLAIVFAPYIAFGVMDVMIQKKIDNANLELESMAVEYEQVEEINDEIKKAQEEIKIYDMLISKSVTWGDILTVIDENIPFKAELINLNVYYENELQEDSENNSQDNQSESDSNGEETQEQEVAIYDQIPNVIVIDGAAQHPTYVGQFVYNLNKIPYFKSVELKNTTEDEEKGVYNFNIILTLKEGVVSGE